MVFVRARRRRRLKRLLCSETDVHAVWQVLFCLTELDAEEDGEQCGGQNTSLHDAIGDGEHARQRPIVLHLTLLTLWSRQRMVRNLGGQPRHARIFHSPLKPDSSKGLGQVYESCI